MCNRGPKPDFIRNSDIMELRYKGFTFGEIAYKLSLKRSVVAGVVRRNK